MAVVAVVGGQWGDEGKGKVVDLLAENASIVARCGGGNNAGHTVINSQGRFSMHLVPSGIFDSTCTCIIGNGVVVDPKVLLGELDSLTARHVDVSCFFVSDRAHMIMPYHIMQDSLEEEARGAGSIGTTRRGVGPAYTDKVSRTGLRIGDLLDQAVFTAKLEAALQAKNRLFTRVFGAEPMAMEPILEQYLAYGQRLRPHITDTVVMLHEALEDGSDILLEGAQGALLDPDFGSYPFVTSSSPIAAGLCTGVGIGPTRVDRVIGVYKAYTTRVGAGPFPTELLDETGEHIRQVGQEFGTTTGRSRRCGWFDAVLSRYTARVNGLSGIALTRLDILDDMPSLKICVAYEMDGQPLRTVPARIDEFARCRPVYEEMPGWQTSTAGATRFEDLPLGARNYVRRLAELVGVPISILSIGPARDQTIILDNPFRLQNSAGAALNDAPLPGPDIR
jgi:adenylosuccinate synthase